MFVDAAACLWTLLEIVITTESQSEYKMQCAAQRTSATIPPHTSTRLIA